MALVVVNQGCQTELRDWLNFEAAQNMVLKLYSNNQTPGKTDTEANYTEATFTGYSAVTLTGGSWTVTSANPAVASYAQQTFTSSANQSTQNIYGYFVIQTTSGKLMWAERFSDAPVPITNNGDNIKITPQVTAA